MIENQQEESVNQIDSSDSEYSITNTIIKYSNNEKLNTKEIPEGEAMLFDVLNNNGIETLITINNPEIRYQYISNLQLAIVNSLNGLYESILTSEEINFILSEIDEHLIEFETNLNSNDKILTIYYYIYTTTPGVNTNTFRTDDSFIETHKNVIDNILYYMVNNKVSPISPNGEGESTIRAILGLHKVLFDQGFIQNILYTLAEITNYNVHGIIQGVLQNFPDFEFDIDNIINGLIIGQGEIVHTLNYLKNHTNLLSQEHINLISNYIISLNLETINNILGTYTRIYDFFNSLTPNLISDSWTIPLIEKAKEGGKTGKILSGTILALYQKFPDTYSIEDVDLVCENARSLSGTIIIAMEENSPERQTSGIEMCKDLIASVEITTELGVGAPKKIFDFYNITCFDQYKIELFKHLYQNLDPQYYGTIESRQEKPLYFMFITKRDHNGAFNQTLLINNQELFDNYQVILMEPGDFNENFQSKLSLLSTTINKLSWGGRDLTGETPNFMFGMHGSPVHMLKDLETKDDQYIDENDDEFYGIIGDYLKGGTGFLYSCSTGHGDSSIAESIAKKTKTRIFAPDTLPSGASVTYNDGGSIKSVTFNNSQTFVFDYRYRKEENRDITEESLLSSIENNLEIYPIPFDDKLYFKLNDIHKDLESASLEIFDINGKLVNQTENIELEESTIDTSNLSKGVYLLRIKVNNEFYVTKKIIKG